MERDELRAEVTQLRGLLREVWAVAVNGKPLGVDLSMRVRDAAGGGS